MNKQDEIEAFLAQNKFFTCLQTGCRITEQGCRKQIEKALKGMELIGKKGSAIKYKSFDDECYRAMFICRECQNGMVNGELKGCRQKYYDNFKGTIHYGAFKDTSNADRSIELDPSGEYIVGSRDVGDIVNGRSKLNHSEWREV